jgi:predicted nucleic acid-binding protein
VGALRLPTSGVVYADAQIAIYTVDRHPLYAPVCDPLWQAAQNGVLTVVSSELTLMETLVGPLRSGDTAQAARRENLWNRPNVGLLPITEDILREAARLRATIPALKTPDAIHAATALLHGCALFVTNDTGFRRVPSLSLAILDDILAAP